MQCRLLSKELKCPGIGLGRPGCGYTTASKGIRHTCMHDILCFDNYMHACMTYYALTTTNHSIGYCVKNAVLDPSACCKQENGLASALAKTNSTCWVSVFLASMYSQQNISASCTCSYLTRPVFKKIMQ